MAEPVHRRDLPGGGKYYVHPLTDERFDSVTTILDTWDKDGLKIWAADLAAVKAFDLLPKMLRAVITPECGNTFNRCYQKHGRENRCERCPCGDCERCVRRTIQWYHGQESSRRALEGTECHEAINHWVLSGGETVSMRDEVKPYFETFLRFVQDYGLTPSDSNGAGSWIQTEATLINREHGYAGTSDAAIRFTRGTPKANELLDRLGMSACTVRVDYKTREKTEERLYNDMVMQGVAYENCDAVLLDDGRELPAPKTNVRAVLQLRPPDPQHPGASVYSFKPMVSGPLEFGAFLGLLTAYRWLAAKGGKTAFDPAVVFPQPYPFDQSGTTPEPTLDKNDVEAEEAARAQLEAEGLVRPRKTDPFALAGAAKPASFTRPGGASAWPAGQPNVAAFEEEIPF